ncbi:DoxX family protein [Psychromonas sp. Urea-02u-13]|uniref:DoxX family protein n=1 Tax=Psychromonas sp. Urea-02u-13 TaxID=2058326 RepID=UPI000C325D67|nr:DoxX family protein [Psychromonas sp. Urea-02u-13]PKG39787.1 oxidoreductase [Psychromonas sp. Urea-02u-13]
MSISLLNKLTTSTANWSSLVLRVPVGLIFMAHGAQKLFAMFGGYGLEGTGQWMESIGLAPGYLMALMAGSAEFFGGLFIIVGLLTRPAAFVLAMTMVVAVLAVHIGNGLFMSNNGYEFGLSLIIISFALMLQGSGRLALDNLIALRTKR